MAIVRAQLASEAEFLAWLQANAVPNIFSRVVLEDDNKTITAYDDDDNVVIQFDNKNLLAYVTDSVSKTYSSGNYSIIDQNYKANIIGCDNGFIMESRHAVGGASLLAMMCAKTNNGKVAVVFASGQTSNRTTVLRSSIKHIARGDNPSMETTTSFSEEAGQQTTLIPFSTNVNVGEVSYTPDAFYIPMNTNYAMGIGKFLMVSDTYISNGYWAIRDGGAQ